MTSETSQRMLRQQMTRKKMTRKELLEAIQTCRNAKCAECRYKDVGGLCVQMLLEDIAIAMKPVKSVIVNGVNGLPLHTCPTCRSYMHPILCRLWSGGHL